MKKIILSIVVLFFCVYNSYSQVAPNAGFEVWDTTHLPDYEEPVGWTSYNSEFATYPVTVTKSTDACTGTYSAMIKNMPYIDIGGNPAVQQGFMITGQSLSNLLLGFKDTIRTLSVQVCLKYTRAGNDSAELFVKMRKWNNTTHQSEDVTNNSSHVRIGQSSSSFYTVTIPVNYKVTFPAPNAPDTCEISFSPSSYNSGAPVTAGGTLWVDNVVLSTTVGTFEIFKSDSRVQVYPNPAKEEVNFSSLPFGSQVIRLIDITGREVSRATVSGINQSMSLKGVSPGIYVYEITSAASKVLATGKVTVVE